MFKWEAFTESLKFFSGWSRTKEKDYQDFKRRLIEETNVRQNETPEEYQRWLETMVIKK